MSPKSCGLNELADEYNHMLDHARQLERELAEAQVAHGAAMKMRRDALDALAQRSSTGTPDAEWCMEAFWRVNPGRNATVPSLYLLDFAREVLRVYGAPASAIKTPNIDGQDFYELCQEYRHARIDAAPQFNALICYLKTGELPWPSYESDEPERKSP